MSTGWALFCALVVTGVWIVVIAKGGNVITAFIAALIVGMLLLAILH
jgi:hypothetical protein